MFNYLAKLAHLFDGFFSHWLLNSSFDCQIQHSSKDFRKRRGSSRPKGEPRPPAPLAKILRWIVEFVNQRWIQQPMGRNPSNHRIPPTTCKRTTSQCASQGCVSEKTGTLRRPICFRKFWAHLAFRKRLPKHPSETHVSEATRWGHNITV